MGFHFLNVRNNDNITVMLPLEFIIEKGKTGRFNKYVLILEMKILPERNVWGTYISPIITPLGTVAQ